MSKANGNLKISSITLDDDKGLPLSNIDVYLAISVDGNNKSIVEYIHTIDLKLFKAVTYEDGTGVSHYYKIDFNFPFTYINGASWSDASLFKGVNYADVRLMMIGLKLADGAEGTECSAIVEFSDHR